MLRKTEQKRPNLYYCEKHFPKFNTNESEIFKNRTKKATQYKKCLICEFHFLGKGK